MKENESQALDTSIIYKDGEYEIKGRKTRKGDEIVINAILEIPVSYIHGCHLIKSLNFIWSPPSRVIKILNGDYDEWVKVEMISTEIKKIANLIAEKIS